MKKSKRLNNCVRCGKEINNNNRCQNLCISCYTSYRYHKNKSNIDLDTFIKTEKKSYERQNGLCLKCHKRQAKSKGFCNPCFSNYKVLNRERGTTVEQYINGEYKIKNRVAWNTKVKKEQFIEDYKNLIKTGLMTPAEYYKGHNISRQGFYERVNRYKNKGLL